MVTNGAPPVCTTEMRLQKKLSKGLDVVTMSLRVKAPIPATSVDQKQSEGMDLGEGLGTGRVSKTSFLGKKRS
jgi:hypothetical protein